MSNRFFPNYPSYCITSPYGPRKSGYHYGIDLVAKRANNTTAVDYITAHTGGVVEECGYNNSAGNYVRIRVSEDTVMSYCHFRDRPPWRKGDTIDQGTVLGMMGSTGNSTGSHLHWGIKRGDKWIDPKPYLDADYVTGGEVLADTPEAAPETPKGETCTVTFPVIRCGNRGETVAVMQALLAHHGYPCANGGVDGIYGNGTKAALEAFQTAHSLSPDAICGPLTWAALMAV